jgi:hypothetical protein
MKGRDEESEHRFIQPQKAFGRRFHDLGGSEGAWVWFLMNPNDEGGRIGASPNEAQAMHEACLSITSSRLIANLAREEIRLK